MNIFTTAQLINDNTGSTYYDTTSGTIKYSPSPILTKLGYDNYDIELTKNAQIEELKSKQFEQDKIKASTKTRTRKVIYVADEERCCASKLDGSQCTLKRYIKSKELCYIHYKKSLPKIEKPVPEVCDKSNTNYKKWFSLKWW
jgi:hypothetical protein